MAFLSGAIYTGKLVKIFRGGVHVSNGMMIVWATMKQRNMYGTVQCSDITKARKREV